MVCNVSNAYGVYNVYVVDNAYNVYIIYQCSPLALQALGPFGKYLPTVLVFLWSVEDCLGLVEEVFVHVSGLCCVCFLCLLFACCLQGEG